MQKQHPTFGKYKILNELGRGGMGVVYKAYDTKLQSYVALKMILNNEREHLQRFFAETIAIAKLNHANIVRFYEYGEVPYPYFTMEYIEGYTLAELIKQKNITAAQLIDTLIPICDALYYSHRNEIMHRDIKPSNIMITKGGVAKIMDFGLAKTENKTQLSKSGQMLGTVAYMAPEQVEGRATYQSDIYSLGATMYEALTFRTVFQGAIDLNIIMQIIEDPPLNLRQLNPDISPYLEAICLKCLQKNPRKRYESFKQLSKEFANYKAHRPIIARRYSSWDVLTNFIRKHKVIFSSVVVIFAMLTISLVVTLQALSFAEEEKRKTKTALNKTMKVIEYSIAEYKILGKDKQFAGLCVDIFEDLESYGENQDWNFIKGFVLSVEGNIEKSLEYYNKQIELNQAHASAYYNRSLIYKNMKEYQKAIFDCNKYIEIKPQDPDGHNNRGLTYKNMKEYQKALVDFNKTISLDPQNSKIYYNRGIVYQYMKEYQKALVDYDRVISLNPEYAEAYNNRGALYKDMKEYQKAMFDFNKAISLDADYFGAYNNRGTLYKDMKEYQKAMLDFNKAISISPKYAQGYNNRGTLYKDMKKYQQALLDFNKAISLEADYFEVYFNRGLVYYQMKKYNEALENFKRILHLYPAKANHALYFTYKSLGNKNKAQYHFLQMKKYTKVK